MRKGSVQKMKGRMKEAVGKVTGDKSREMKGKAEKTTGKAREQMEKAADKARRTGRDR